MPKLSVIVPVYNGEKYLNRCLDSILAQSFSDFELILIDDGSKDNSGKLCDVYAAADSRVTVAHTENRGVARARKTGLEMATGEYVSYVDCDDWIDTELLHRMADCAYAHDADVVVCGMCMEPQSKLRFSSVAAGVYGKAELERDIYPRMIYDLQTDTSGIAPSLCDKLIRRTLLSDVYNEADLTLALGEDGMCTYPCLLAAERLCVIENAVYYHYWQEHSEQMHQMGAEFLLRIKALAKQMQAHLWNEPITQIQSKCYIAQYSTNCIRQIMVRNRVMGWKEKKQAILAFLADATIQVAFSTAQTHITDPKLRLKLRLLGGKHLVAFGCLAAGKELVLYARGKCADQ